MVSVDTSVPWLTPNQQMWAVEGLLKYGLLKIDNNRSLPLKSGGKTDIYITIRDARNNPEAIKFLTDLYAIPLKLLEPNRFAEIPDSVSCIAGPLSIKCNIPYITIRETAKEGRATDSKIIGRCNPGEKIPIIDDVVTDGASKVIPISECKKRNAQSDIIIVLVDRQQGWKEKIGSDVTVWPGMTLHDARRCLIEIGALQRCDPATEAKNPIIIALDGKSWEEILPIIDLLRTTGCIFKVNDLLFEEGFERLIPDLSIYGRVMVDIKGHDIPDTVKHITTRLQKYSPWGVTVHASGGGEMISAAVEALKGTPTKVIGVTLLTSINDVGCKNIYTRNPADQVLVLASIAIKNGAHGLVCSPDEVGILRRTYPETALIVPGIRSAEIDIANDDQKRIGTPSQTIKDGANYIVMGRQIFQAPNPVDEVHRILKKELGLVL